MSLLSVQIFNFAELVCQVTNQRRRNMEDSIWISLDGVPGLQGHMSWVHTFFYSYSYNYAGTVASKLPDQVEQ